MAIEKGNSDAMNNLGYLYHNEPEKKNLDEAIKYYQMAIEKGNSAAMHNLGNLYCDEPEKKNLDEAIKYYKMAIIFGNKNAKIQSKLSEIYAKNPKYMINDILENDQLKKQNEKQKEYITELELIPGGVEYEKCKEHFEELCKNVYL